MKKALITAFAVAATLGASAQTLIVKDVEAALKGKNPDYQELLTKIKPALTNPESSHQVETWVTAGKLNMGIYDNLYKLKLIGQEVDIPLMGNSLMNGIEDYVTALPLDSVPDAKGKIKAKYSKDIIKQIKDNYKYLNEIAVDLYNCQDYIGAYNAWDMYMELPTNAVLGKNAPLGSPDSIMCDVAFNMGITAWQADSLQQALSAFRKAIALGYDKKQGYDYAITVAANLNNIEDITELATQAYPLFGNEDPKYLQLMINDKIEKKQYDEARQMLDEAIAAQPDNAQLYYVLGILEETLEDKQAALEDYKKAVALNPDLAQAQYAVGRTICNIAYDVDDQAGKGTQEEYMEVRSNTVDPMFREAAQYLEKAYSLDPDNMGDALHYLRNVYYNLHDEENLNRVEAL